MITVAIHQPNHLPWLGYFAKIARADIFVFLDDVQYPKGSYVNRVRIGAHEPSWLTVPVKVSLGDPISAVTIARPDWARAHRDRLLQTYRSAAAFRDVWPQVEEWLAAAPAVSLAAANIYLIEAIALRLGLACRFITSSGLDIAADSADVRLCKIVHRLAPAGIYLSGTGGANYQSEAVFSAHGLTLTYSDFAPAPYPRSGQDFQPGLSVLDAAFHVGWDAVATMVRTAR